MTIAKDLEIEIGSDYALALVVNDPIANGPVNLTGATILCQCRTAWNVPPFFSATHVITAAAQGKATVFFMGASTASLTPQRGRYDILIMLADGSRHRFAEGSVNFQAAMSQP